MDVVVEVVLTQYFLSQYHIGTIKQQGQSKESAGILNVNPVNYIKL